MITFEKIREIERLERDSKRLQKLPEDFLDVLNAYLKKKESIAEKTSTDIKELENVKNIIRRLLETREQKLVDSALFTVRTGMPPENLLPVEHNIFHALVDKLKEYRKMFFTELEKTEQKKIIYRVKKSVPSFVGPDMKVYELKENDIVDLPKSLNDLLLKDGVIEKIDES